jgi:hypothetical protein
MIKAWFVGLLNALISGLASGLTGLAVGVPFKQILEIAAVSAIVSLGKWLAQHPLPGSNGTTPPSAAPPVTPAVQAVEQSVTENLMKKL